VEPVESGSDALHRLPAVHFRGSQVLRQLFVSRKDGFALYSSLVSIRPLSPADSELGKLAAGLSLLLWFSVGLAGRAIGFLG
jgi:hypothetical protein